MPSSQNRFRLEEHLSSQNILKVLTICSLILAVLATLVLIRDQIHYGQSYHGLSPLWGLGIILFFIFVYHLNRHSNILASTLFLANYFVLNSYFAYRWGVELPTVIIFYLLLVVMTAILRGIKSGWFMAGATIIILFIGAFLESRHILNPNLYWRANPATTADKIPEALTVIILISICALYVKQIKQALKKAWIAEELLRQERDNLEITVETRTKELKQAQLEKMTQLYRLAEFGRLAAGIFHDLVNPLTAVSLNLRQLKGKEVENDQQNLNRALKATEKMGDFVTTLKRQLKQENQTILFSVNEEIRQTILLLNYPLIKTGLDCQLSLAEDFHLIGDPIKFNQIILNLVANAIDAYQGKPKPYQPIKVKVRRHKNQIIITISDHGAGIDPKNTARIFEAFFSTKNNKGLGIGLSATKSITEKSFHGTISFKSELNVGTKFIVSLPIKNESSRKN